MTDELILGIETAINGGSLALMRDGVVMESISGGVARAEQTLPGIRTLLDRAGVSINSLKMVAVSRGPGSFTGIRGGIATALGLARATGSQLVGVSLFDAIAASNSNGNCTVAIALGRGQIGVQRFESEGSASTPISVAEHEIRVLEMKPGPFLFCGSPENFVERRPDLVTVNSNLAELVAKRAPFVVFEPIAPIYIGK